MEVSLRLLSIGIYIRLRHGHGQVDERRPWRYVYGEEGRHSLLLAESCRVVRRRASESAHGGVHPREADVKASLGRRGAAAAELLLQHICCNAARAGSSCRRL